MIKYKKRQLLLFLAATAITWSGHAQDSFCKEYLSAAPSGISSAAYNMTESNDNKLMLTGRTAGDVSPIDDFFVSRVNPVNGNLLGFIQYGSSFDDRAFDCETTSDGGMITVGYGWQTMTERDRVLDGLPLNTGNSTFSIIKIDSDGTIGWEQHLDIGIYDDMAFSMLKKTDGTYLILGRMHESSGKILSLVHINESGVILGTYSYNQVFVSGEELFGVDIIQAQDGGFYMLAMDGYDFVSRNDPYEFKGLGSNCYIIKLDAALNYEFAKDITLSRPEFTVNRMMAYEMTQANDGDLAIVGYIRSESPGGGGPGLQFDGFLIETDALGNSKGSRFFDFVGTDRAIPMAIQSMENGYVISGTTTIQGFIYAVDNDLTTLGSSLLNSTASDEVYSIFQKGSYFFFGGTESSVSLSKKKGNLINCCETPEPVRLLEGITNTIVDVPVGFSKRSETFTLGSAFTIVDFEESEIDNCPSMAPLLSAVEREANDFLTVFPNPTTDILNIQMTNFIEGDRIELCSVTGKRIATRFVNSALTTIEVGGLSSGTYVLSYHSGDQTYREKVTIAYED